MTQSLGISTKKAERNLIMPRWVARKPSSGLKESKKFFWTPQPLRRCECRAALAYNPASDQSYGLCERYP